MHINEKFFTKALNISAKNNNRRFPIIRVARLLLETALELRGKEPEFNRSIVTKALDQKDIKDFGDRRLYSSFLHSYFGQLPRMRRKSTKIQPVTTGSLPYKVEEDLKSHQFRWII